MSSVESEMDGILIVVEGVDGAGKSTQVALLAEALRSAGLDVVTSREPTDGRWGTAIRQSAIEGRMSLEDELHAFVEDRREHTEQVIQPAMEAGAIVLLDRYFYSNAAYQGTDRSSVQSILDRNDFAPIPDIVLLLDLLPSVSVRRIQESRGEQPNEFEGVAYLEAVRDRFLWMAENSEHFAVIDANVSPEQLLERLIEAVVDGPLRRKRANRLDQVREQLAEYLSD